MAMRAQATPRYVRAGENVAIRRVVIGDEAEFVGLAEMSRSLHQPWITAPATAEEFRKYLVRFDRFRADGFVIYLRQTGNIVGFVNINEIIRGPYQRGIIGYGAFSSTTGFGYMTEGVRLLLEYACGELKLHRIEADIQPSNTSSISLAKRLNFRNEGFSPGFICINGEWVDHERWAITCDMLNA